MYMKKTQVRVYSDPTSCQIGCISLMTDAYLTETLGFQVALVHPEPDPRSIEPHALRAHGPLPEVGIHLQSWINHEQKPSIEGQWNGGA